IFFSFIIFLCIEPLARRLNKWGVKKSIASGISILVFSLLILAAFSAAAFLVTKQGTELIDKLPQYQVILTEQIATISQEIEKQLGRLPADFDLVERSTELVAGISGYLQVFAQKVLMAIIGYASSFTTFVF